MNAWELKQWRNEICQPLYEYLLFKGMEPKNITVTMMQDVAAFPPDLSDIQLWLAEQGQGMQAAVGMAVIMQAVVSED